MKSNHVIGSITSPFANCILDTPLRFLLLWPLSYADMGLMVGNAYCTKSGAGVATLFLTMELGLSDT
ncbi:unnamed protein product [Camellia sinensis]